MSNIVIISGGMRPTGNTPRIARVVEAELKARKHGTFLIDLAETQLPLWDEGTWGVAPLAEKWAKQWAPLAAEIEKADGLVILSPEYHGMVPSALQNLLLLLGNGPLVSHKPALLIGVSSSNGGLYPVSQLRLNGAKNNRMLFLPDHLAIRDASNMFTGAPKPEHAEADKIVTERLHWNLTQLEDYIEPLKAVRAKGHATNATFPNGM